MSNFAELLQTNPPRLVIKFRYAGDGSEQFEWGIEGKMPLLSIIGKLLEVQHCLWADPHDDEYDCPEQAVVIMWDASTSTFRWFIHKDTPVDAMNGMLETVKMALMQARAVQHAAAQRMQSPILGPDGRPMMG